MDDDSILPNGDMENMRREIELLKKKQGIGSRTEQEDPKDSAAALSRSINSLMRIFKEASEDMKMDTHDAVLVSQKLDKILDRLDKIEAQNEKIAKGIVAIADMVEDIQDDAQRPSVSQKMSQPMSPQQMQRQFSEGQPETKPLPTYNLPPDDKKKTFMSFKI